MLTPNGEQALRHHADTAFPKQLLQVTPRVYHALSYGHSNVTVIIGEQSVILVDALDTDVRAATLKAAIAEITPKPVKTIIYTHGHPDHRGGAGAFADTVTEIIAFAPKKPALKYSDKIGPALFQRTVRQFGYQLTDSEVITQGLGIREGQAVGEGTYAVLPPTTVYAEDVVERVIDGVALKLVSAVGETDDQIFVWLPEDNVLCCGDNYYGCWPNLYAIRGSQYRDVAAWVDSLGEILAYPAEALLPGHTKPILGHDEIQTVLGNYRDAIAAILHQTLDCISQGLGLSETVARVQLPAQYRALPYVQEFYGSVDWSVRSIYQGYVGWFDGNPANLHPLSDQAYAQRMIPLLGGEAQVIAAIQQALAAGDCQWAVQLCDLLLADGRQTETARQLKAQGFLALARLETSANGRHYYIASAKELTESK